MNEFMLIFRNVKSDAMPTSEQMETMKQEWRKWISGISRSGKYNSTNRLLPEGKTIQPGNVITDGPFVEGKEMVGGYLIVKASSLNEAVEIAKSCPGLQTGGNVEVRSVMSIDRNPESANFLNETVLVTNK